MNQGNCRFSVRTPRRSAHQKRGPKTGPFVFIRKRSQPAADRHISSAMPTAITQLILRSDI